MGYDRLSPAEEARPVIKSRRLSVADEFVKRESAVLLGVLGALVTRLPVDVVKVERPERSEDVRP